MCYNEYEMSKKKSTVLVYTGDGKGKTSAAIGAVARALGDGQRVAFVQFIKAWPSSEDNFFDAITPIYGDKFEFYRGGKGFYNAGEMSAENVSETDHRQAALNTYQHAVGAVASGQYFLVVCDEINNAVADGLLEPEQLKELIEKSRRTQTNLILTGRNFPPELSELADTITNMTKVKHTFDEGNLAQKGLDY